MDYDIDEVTGSRETIGERLAGLIPTEIEMPEKPGEGYKRAIGGNSVRFKCRQCKKMVELGFAVNSTEWGWKIWHGGRYNLFCGYNCMRAYEREHKLQETTHNYVSHGRQAWTPDQDRELIRLYRSGMTYAEIGKAIGRSLSAVSHRLYTLREDIFEGDV